MDVLPTCSNATLDQSGAPQPSDLCPKQRGPLWIVVLKSNAAPRQTQGLSAQSIILNRSN